MKLYALPTLAPNPDKGSEQLSSWLRREKMCNPARYQFTDSGTHAPSFNNSNNNTPATPNVAVEMSSLPVPQIIRRLLPSTSLPIYNSLIMCVVCPILFVYHCVLFWAWSVILCDMCICLLCLIILTLSPGKNPFAVLIIIIQFISIQFVFIYVQTYQPRCQLAELARVRRNKNKIPQTK
jgi:hypothetical protein